MTETEKTNRAKANAFGFSVATPGGHPLNRPVLVFIKTSTSQRFRTKKGL